MRTSDFDFALPEELIAQTPAFTRDSSRLMVLRRDAQKIEHRAFRDFLDYLRREDVLVLNNSRVIPARLHGVNAITGGQFEILLLEENAPNDWWTMMRPGNRARVGTGIILCNRFGQRENVRAVVTEKNAAGHRRLLFDQTPNIVDLLPTLGEVPLPPYIMRPSQENADEDLKRYQTVFAEPPGSVAAPTAGLHFTRELLDEIRSRGIRVCFVTLHVGAGTFAPVKTEKIEAHKMHEERFELSHETTAIINETKRSGGRVIAVGTTTLRVLETPALHVKKNEKATIELIPQIGRCNTFIYPPHDFKIADALLTNFHLPRSTLLMLVSAFAAPQKSEGIDLVLSAYRKAIQERYRFFSYGDAMLLL